MKSLENDIKSKDSNDFQLLGAGSFGTVFKIKDENLENKFKSIKMTLFSKVNAYQKKDEQYLKFEKEV